jgi:hypothetical protein
MGAHWQGCNRWSRLQLQQFAIHMSLPSTAIAAVPSVPRQVSVVTGFLVSEIVMQPHISTFAPQ